MSLREFYLSLKPKEKEDANQPMVESIKDKILETKENAPHAKCAALGSISLNEPYVKEFEDAGFKFDIRYHKLEDNQYHKVVYILWE
jgi:hypothetical protein